MIKIMGLSLLTIGCIQSNEITVIPYGNVEKGYGWEMRYSQRLEHPPCLSRDPPTDFKTPEEALGDGNRALNFIRSIDLESLAKEAAMVVLRRNIHKFNLDDDEQIPEEVLSQLRITRHDFQEGLKVVRPSAMREVLVETPDIKWEDVGGVDVVKTELKEAIEWPLKFPASFETLGIKPP